MPEVIPILEVQFSSKIELLEDALVLRNKVFASSAERHAASRPKGCTPHRELPTGGQEGEQLQLQKNLPLFSEGEAQELTQVEGSHCLSGTVQHLCPLHLCLIPLLPKDRPLLDYACLSLKQWI